MIAKNSLVFPPLPDKRFFTIGETATLVLSKPHILRYWENQLGDSFMPIKKNGTRRYYSRDNVFLLRKIQSMRIEQGFTIAGVQKALSQTKNPQPSQQINYQFVVSEINSIINLL